MKRLMTMLVMVAMVATGAHAQFNLGKIKNSIKKSAENKAEWKVRKAADKAMDTAADKVEGATKKKAKKKVEKGVDKAKENISNTVTGNAADSGEAQSATKKTAVKSDKFRKAPSPAIDVKDLDLATKAEMDEAENVSLNNISSSMSVAQLKTAATLYFRQQIKHINAGDFDEIAKEMGNKENTGVKIYEALNKKDMGEALMFRKNMLQLNGYYTDCMFGGIPYDACSVPAHEWNGVDGEHQVALEMYGNMEVPQFKKDTYYKLYDYFVTLAEKESKSEACKKLYLQYALAYHDKPADKKIFTDENPEESDEQWKNLNGRLSTLLAANGGGELKTIAQLRTDKKNADAAVLAQEKADMRRRASELPKGVNDPKAEARAMNYLKNFYKGTGNTPVKVIIEKGASYDTNILGVRIKRYKTAVFVVRYKDGTYHRDNLSIVDTSTNGTNWRPGHCILTRDVRFDAFIEIDYKE